MFSRVRNLALVCGVTIVLLSCGTAGSGSEGGTLTLERASEAQTSDACRGNHDCAQEETCVFGKCIQDPYQCNESWVTCEESRPTCPAGETPSIVEGCWDKCVPLTACRAFFDCNVCDENGWLCVRSGRSLLSDLASPDHKCVELSPSCDPAQCECMSEACAPETCVGVEQNMMSCTGEYLDDVPPPSSGGGSGGSVGQGGRDPG